MVNIEHLLPLVEKPSRYIDHEINASKKDFATHFVRMVFAFPDLYELGISHLGLKILYSIVNKLDYCMADRVYLPWLDLLELMKAEGTPLFALESRRAVKEFDLLGITLQSELTFSNVLELIARSQIPMFSGLRNEGDPIVMAGGPCASNPLPLSPFIDVFFFGEAEEGIVQIAEVLRDFATRDERLRILATMESCWVPRYDEESKLISINEDPFAVHIPRVSIGSRKYPGFSANTNLHSPQLLSWQLATHNRYVAEIMRGCSRGCRFCHAGFFYRPVRERNPSDIVTELLREVQSSGWDEAGLISLSSSDYTCIRELMDSLLKLVDTSKTHVSLPSLRVDSLDDALVQLMKSLGREGLTIAPEAGSQRLRDVINKNLSEAEIMRGVEIALELGWQKIKLYFMIGLPEETEEDIDAIIDLITQINQLGKRRLSISVTLSPFTPKPFTPFQWAAMLDKETLLERSKRIKSSFFKAKNIRIKYHTIENSLLEACITRGDLDMAKVIYFAWQNGACFDAWNENWDFQKWERAFEQAAISPTKYLSARATDEVLPWDFVDIGVSKEFLQEEYQKSLAALVTEDCRAQCSFCGACKEGCGNSYASNDLEIVEEATNAGISLERKIYDPQRQFRYRIRYRKIGLLRFIAHLDWMRMLFRRISMLDLATVFTMGFSPHPKVSLSPPLPVGVMSECEYFDISFYEPYTEQQILEAFHQNLIPDFEIIECAMLREKPSVPVMESLTIKLVDPDSKAVEDKISEFHRLESVPYTKQTESRCKSYELKEIIHILKLHENTIWVDKKLESPSLYDVLSCILGIEKKDLYKAEILRRHIA